MSILRNNPFAFILLGSVLMVTLPFLLLIAWNWLWNSLLCQWVLLHPCTGIAGQGTGGGGR